MALLLIMNTGRGERAWVEGDGGGPEIENDVGGGMYCGEEGEDIVKEKKFDILEG